MFPILKRRLTNQLTNYSRSLSGLATIRQFRFLFVFWMTTLLTESHAAFFAVRVLRFLQYNSAAIITEYRENHENFGSQRPSY